MEKTEKVMKKVIENHGIFCNLKSMNPASKNHYLSGKCATKGPIQTHLGNICQIATTMFL